LEFCILYMGFRRVSHFIHNLIFPLFYRSALVVEAMGRSTPNVKAEARRPDNQGTP
jgi:hypothetical protein